MKILLVLFLTISSNVFADICVIDPSASGCNTEKPARDFICAPNFYVADHPRGYPICSQFGSREEAERHYFHCQETVAYLSEVLHAKVKTWSPLITLEQLYQTRITKGCSIPSFEIYPDSNICSQFNSWRDAEGHYYACSVTVWSLYSWLVWIQITEAK